MEKSRPVSAKYIVPIDSDGDSNNMVGTIRTSKSNN